MYSTCVHCHAPLGHNEDVEEFPVGRRLAFDSTRGRLWVVCPSCLRWNLTPIEERWEAIETCERLYEGTRQRFSTDQIGLGRLHSGLDLIRVGRPMRPEFAAWRYGDRFGRRRRRFLVRSAAGSVMTSAGFLAQIGILPIPLIVGGVALVGLHRQYLKLRSQQVVARVAGSGGDELPVTRGDLLKVDFAREAASRWALEIPNQFGPVRLVDGAALHVGALAMAEMNADGASADQLSQAIKKLEWFEGPEGMRRFAVRKGLRKMGYEQRLAIEMALHEESERRALEGELAGLERMWREAEELASIADNLLLPASVTEWIDRHLRNRGRRSGGRTGADPNT